MKITVTGGFGFIGSHLVPELKKKKYDVTILDTRIPAYAETDAAIADLTNFQELMNITTLRLQDSDIIIHLGGYVDSHTENHPFQGFSTNVMGTLNILETMRMIGIKKIVFASTYLIYEGYTGEVDEHTKPDIDAITLYSKSKLASEWLIKKYAEKYGIEYVMLRFGSIYGEEDRCSNLLNDFMDSAVNGVSIDVWGDGTAKKPLTDVSDIATGIVACLNETNEIFNVASNEHPSVNDLVEILKELNPEFIVNYDKTKSARAYPIVVTEKIRERTGWTQKTKFRDNVARIYESMKNK